MGNTFYLSWEPGFMIWLQQFLGSFGEKVMPILSATGEELVMVLIFGFFYWCCNKELGVYLGTNLMVNLTWNPLLKNIALRRRPYMDNEAIRCLKPVEKDADLYDIAAQGYSFPSGHSSNATTFYGSIAAGLKKKAVTIAVTVICFLVGLSRVAVGVHYPTDVLCGWLLGIVIVLVVTFLQKKIKNRALLFLILILTSVPGWFYCTSDDFFTGFGMMIGFFSGVLFENRFVRFEITRVWWRGAIRLALGCGIFLGLNTVLKLPFPKETRDAGDLLAHVIRTGRYALTVFVVTGVYPFAFRILDRRLRPGA